MAGLNLLTGLANSRYAPSNAQASSDLELQKQAQAQPQAAPGGSGGNPSVAQALGAQVSQLQASTKLGQIGTRSQQLGQIGQQGLQAQNAQNTSQTQQLQLGGQAQQQAQIEKLAQTANVNKQDLFAARQVFANQQGQLALSNTTQLTDFAALNAKNQEQFNEYSQAVSNAYQMKQTLLDTAFTKLKTELTYQQQLAAQIQDQIQTGSIQARDIAQSESIRQAAMKQQVQLQQKLVDLQKSIYENRAKSANHQMVGQAVGSVVGGVAGAYFGPAGAMAGAAVGGGIGGTIGSQVK